MQGFLVVSELTPAKFMQQWKPFEMNFILFTLNGVKPGMPDQGHKAALSWSKM